MCEHSEWNGWACRAARHGGWASQLMSGTESVLMGADWVLRWCCVYGVMGESPGMMQCCQGSHARGRSVSIVPSWSLGGSAPIGYTPSAARAMAIAAMVYSLWCCLLFLCVSCNYPSAFPCKSGQPLALLLWELFVPIILEFESANCGPPARVFVFIGPGTKGSEVGCDICGPLWWQHVAKYDCFGSWGSGSGLKDALMGGGGSGGLRASFLRIAPLCHPAPPWAQGLSSTSSLVPGLQLPPHPLPGLLKFDSSSIVAGGLGVLSDLPVLWLAESSTVLTEQHRTSRWAQ